eukprot:CAMPEP_0116987638 /NCGR_PEP_ID=MMETSP0467-20121206/63638_1 /TAXON_ID=283647 /ORGANISM="Mesodinium pulex, Strain SPMC105" /LENGTH=126 /DNA_ID=CAMNT_0004683521 /DNA_START=1 /DNA_END=381 /DNA_ORIENTATION=+
MSSQLICQLDTIVFVKHLYSEFAGELHRTPETVGYYLIVDLPNHISSCGVNSDGHTVVGIDFVIRVLELFHFLILRDSIRRKSDNLRVDVVKRVCRLIAETEDQAGTVCVHVVRGNVKRLSSPVVG